MVLEAVPCVFSRPQEANGAKKCFGYLIRTSADGTTEQVQVQIAPSTSGAASMRNVPPGVPIMVNSDNNSPPKILMPAGMMRLAPQQDGSGMGMGRTTASFSNGWPNNQKMMPQANFAPSAAAPSPSPSQPRSMSVCSTSSMTESSPMSPASLGFPMHKHDRQNGPTSRSGPMMSQLPNGTTWVVSTGTAGTSLISTTSYSAAGTSMMSSSSSYSAASSYNGVMLSDSSTTPDSGIQSVPTSPPDGIDPLTPPTIDACDSVCEERDDFEDFTDMPRLIPADQEEADEPCSSNTSYRIPPPLLVTREDCASHGSECETAAAPSISISPSMDSDEIVNRLMALDPEKASVIAALIKQKTQRKRRSGNSDKSDKLSSSSPMLKKTRVQPTAEVVSPEPPKEEVMMLELTTSLASPLCAPKSSTSAVDKDDHDDVVEVTRKDRRSTRSKKKEVAKVKEKTPKVEHDVESSEDAAVRYRLAVQKQLQAALTREVEMCTDEMGLLKLGGGKLARRKWKTWLELMEGQLKYLQAIRKDFSADDADAKLMREIRRTLQLKCDRRAESKRELASSTPRAVESREPAERTKKARRGRPRSTCIAADAVPQTSTVEREKDANTETYEMIPKSFPGPEVVEGWEAPTPQCGCARGACTSDEECVNRALRVQCTVACTAQLCANKKFWKEDTSRLVVSSTAKGRGGLRTRHARRAGEFLCEFVGEVVPAAEARRRFVERTNDELNILCLNSLLFVDATHKSNVSRFIRHSCRPNSRAEVWSVHGTYRMGIFSLYDIASGAEITIDKNRLLPEAVPCSCGVSECRKEIFPARNTLIADCWDGLNEEKVERRSRRFLLRNKRNSIRCAMVHGLPRSWSSSAEDALPGTLKSLEKLLDAVVYRVRRIDGSMPYKALRGYNALKKLFRTSDNFRRATDLTDAFNVQMNAWLADVDDDDIERSFKAMRAKVMEAERTGIVGDIEGQSQLKKTPTKKAVNGSNVGSSGGVARLISRQTDLSYLSSEYLVGSYNPDEAWPSKAKETDNAVRCVCGSLDEDGEMLQCDLCHFWLHMDCVVPSDVSGDYKCFFCTSETPHASPSTDVMLPTQPTVRFGQCAYYKALVNQRSIQVRLNETVFVQKAIGDEHKKTLRRLEEINEKNKKKHEPSKKVAVQSIAQARTSPLRQETFHRKDLRIFRVERLFTAPGNNRFVFGFYYAWPHETFCDSQRIFHTNEVFATPLYDTLPLDAVVGRCVVLDPNTWSRGRPSVPLFKEVDVYVCEYQIDRNQRSFEKIPPKNRYAINTQPSVFAAFKHPRPLRREFTPFIVTDRSNTTTPGRPSTKSSNSSSFSPVDAESRRMDKEKKLAARNLNKVVDKIASLS